MTPTPQLRPVFAVVDPLLACAIPVTRLSTCTARWGDRECGNSFVQTALTADGSIEAYDANPEAADYEPGYCAKCQRHLLSASARQAALAGNLGTVRHPETQSHRVAR